MASFRDANQEREATTFASTRKEPGNWWSSLSLRPRMLLLVVASIVPLVCVGAVREYLDYKSERDEFRAGLLIVARSTAAMVERDLQLRVARLETLAMSPTLEEDDLGRFDYQAQIYLARQPRGTLLELAFPDHRLRMYGQSDKPFEDVIRGDTATVVSRVFDTAQPVVADVKIEPTTGLQGFSVDVPVIRDGRVLYDLFTRVSPVVVMDLIRRQYLPPGAVATVFDASGRVVARVPDADRFIGSSIAPDLWSVMMANSEGITWSPTPKGVRAVAAYSHVMPFNWAVVVGLSEDVALASLRFKITCLYIGGTFVLAAGLILAMLVVRAITRPIDQLRRLAVQDGRIDHAGPMTTGLSDTDMVAQAMVAAAAGRQEAAMIVAQNDARFRALFEQAPSGTILLDPDTMRIIDSNTVAASHAGFSVEELRGRAVSDFAPASSSERIRAICRSAVSGKSTTYETNIQGKLGTRDLLIVVGPVHVAGRTFVLLNQVDVTDLRHADAGRRINEERLELARQSANLGVWDWNLVNGRLSWSDHQWSLHGLEPQPDGPDVEVWRHAVHPADLRRTEDDIAIALKAPGNKFTTEYSVVWPDGSHRRLLCRGQTVRGGDGRTVRMIGISMDVTARYEAEMARNQLIRTLETERSRLSEIIEALPLGVEIVDTNGRFVLGNAVMKRLYGLDIRSTTVASSGEWIAYDTKGNRVGPEDFPTQRALRLGEATLPGVEFLFRDFGGRETWFRVGSVPLRGDVGQVREALGIFLDIDAEKRRMDVQQQTNARLEQRVREEMAAREAAQQRAAHAERMHALGQIAGGIAHDFNNVLQAVAGGAALIERRPEDADRVLRNARIVLDAARRGAAITSRLLAFSRRGDLRAEDVDTAALLVDMAEVLNHTLGGSVVCKVDVLPDMPPLFADRGQLETVLVNLATNARDAMPLGGTLTFAADIEVVSTALPHPAGLAPGSYVRIVASDTGSGMDHAVLARVTEPFFTTKELGKGTGLGLAMAQAFVDQSGGSLSIDSVVGQGTRIMLWLPIASGSVGLSPVSAAGSGSGPNKPCVLLVDDDAIVRDVLTLSLEDSGYAVLTADSGPAALTQLAAGIRVDIIVSGLTMPAMNGPTLIRAVQERRPGLPAILLTGYAGDGTALAFDGAISGTFSLLRKPVSGRQLVERIDALLASRKQASIA